MLRNKAARIYITGYSLHAAELYIVRVWLPALLAAALIARGEDEVTAVVGAATIGGLAMASGAIGPVMGGAMSDRWGARGRHLPSSPSVVCVRSLLAG